MKKKKRSIALGLATLMLLTGCGANGNSQNEDVQNSTLSFYYYDGLRVFKPTQPIWEFIQEETGITLTGSAPTTVGSDPNEQFNLMLTESEHPDIIHATKNNLLQTGEDLLIPLDDLIAEYAPNIQKMLEENPNVAQSSSINGEIYFIPYLLSGSVSEVMYIRKDWCIYC